MATQRPNARTQHEMHVQHGTHADPVQPHEVTRGTAQLLLKVVFVVVVCFVVDDDVEEKAVGFFSVCVFPCLLWAFG